jgi:NDP-sugar pyrophosphorylase family protein
MGNLTAELPKPMLPINGKPMLEHIVNRMRQAGIAEILIVTGFKRELIEEHFRDGFPGISFAVQQTQEGTAKAVQLGKQFVGSDPFILTFGDIICGAENYTGIARTLSENAAAAVLGVKSVDDPWQGAAVYAEPSGVVTKIVEKPAPGTSATHWNSAGLYAFAPIVFDEIDTVPKSERGEYEISTAIEQLIDHHRPVRIFAIEGAWRDVGRPEDLAQAGNDLDDLKDSVNR